MDEAEYNILRALKKQCLIQLHLQSTSAYWFHYMHSGMSFSNILLGSILSISLFSTSSPTWKIASGVMAISSTFLTTLSKQLGIAERAQLHCTVVKQYHSLIQDMNIFMGSSIRGQTTAEFIKKTKIMMDKLMDMQPVPSLWIVKKYERTFKQSLEQLLFPEFEKLVTERALRWSSRASRFQPNSQKHESIYQDALSETE